MSSNNERENINTHACELCGEYALYKLINSDDKLKGKIFCESCKQCSKCADEEDIQMSTPENWCNYCYCENCGKSNGQPLCHPTDLEKRDELGSGYCFGECVLNNTLNNKKIKKRIIK